MSNNSVYENGYNSYIKSIAKYKPLTLEEEKRNFQLYKKTGKEVYRNRLIKSNLKYVVHIANQYRNCGIPMMQLISEGNEGLFIAIDRFNYNKGNIKIFTYATHWIKQRISAAVIEEIKKNSQYKEIEASENKLYNEYNNGIFYQTHPLYDEEENKNETYANIAEQLMVCLDEREMEIIKKLYGIDEDGQKNLSEISDDMHLSQERISQLRDKAMLKMRSLALENNIKI